MTFTVQYLDGDIPSGIPKVINKFALTTNHKDYNEEEYGEKFIELKFENHLLFAQLK